MSYSYSDTPSCCSSVSAELKLYQAFIFSIPIFFTFILLLLFYLFYLRRQRGDSMSLQMIASYRNNPRLSESGLKKEHREMLPIIVFRESFSIKDTQCSVCLGDYQAEDRLQQIPVCSHTFHMDCIDHWLATHSTCPLCRLSLVHQRETLEEESQNEVVSEGNNIQDEQSPEISESTRAAEHVSNDLSNTLSEHELSEQSSVDAVVVLDIEERRANN